MSNPCNDNVTGAGDLTKRDADDLLLRMKNLAELRAKRYGMPLPEALKQIEGELIAEEKTMSKIYRRNELLDIQAKRNIKNFVKRFPTVGFGLLTFLEGSNKVVKGARLSVDYQSKALHGKYFGRLVAELEDAGVLKDFKRADKDFTLDVYREMGQLHPGQPAKQVTGNLAAFKVAQIIDKLTEEMVGRQNRAGAYIRRMPGYIVRQTHDQAAIRSLGSLGNNVHSLEESYKSWSEFVKPLIDYEKTFGGADPEKVLRNVHEALYSGIHGPARDEADIMGFTVHGSLAGKVSKMRVLHFKDPESAWKYNQALGVRDFKEAIMADVHTRARNIALMENLGTRPEQNLDSIIRELQEEYRTHDQAAKHLDSLRDWKIKAAMNEITGRNEVSNNPSLSNIMSTGKVMLQMSKMGAVTLSSFSDRAFLQSEMTYQGVSVMQKIGAQLGAFMRKSPESVKMIRMMGVAMDGLMGNALSRYSSHSSTSGWAHSLQKKFFDLNMLNLWTDSGKSAAARVFSAHLGDHSHLSFPELPGELQNVLSLYDITPSRWDAIRSTAHNHEGQLHVLPDKLGDVPDSKISELVRERGLNPTEANITRERNLLETSLRTYFVDRTDIAIPTPGAAERKYATWNTQAGTPLGESIRLLMMFKSFPITILNKVVSRNIYGQGSMSIKNWLVHDTRGKFNLAMLMAMGTFAGYLSNMAHDLLKGRMPAPLTTEDGGVNWPIVNRAAVQGGSLGIMGDVLMSQYDHDYHSFLESMAGPAFSQLNTAFDIKTQLQAGKNVAAPAGKLLSDNAPFINLFYIRPILDYFVLWNLQEMMSPGSLRKMESTVQTRNNQDFFIRPSEVVNK